MFWIDYVSRDALRHKLPDLLPRVQLTLIENAFELSDDFIDYYDQGNWDELTQIALRTSPKLFGMVLALHTGCRPLTVDMIGVDFMQSLPPQQRLEITHHHQESIKLLLKLL